VLLFWIVHEMELLKTAFTDLGAKSATNLNEALAAMAVNQPNADAMSVYKEILINLSSAMSNFATQSASSSFAQAHGSNGAASTTSLVQVQNTTYPTYCEIGAAAGFNSIGSITAANVWPNIDIEALQTASPSECLASGSFSDGFMSNFNMATYVCSKKSTNVKSVVEALQSAFDVLNKTISDASLTGFYEQSDWDADRATMQTNLTALAHSATTYADPFLAQPNTTAVLTQSCDYNDADMKGRMNATCPCFIQGLETTDAIMQLTIELSGYGSTQMVNFNTWSWNIADWQGAYCSTDLSYKNNTEYFCNSEWSTPYGSYTTCEDAVASFCNTPR
jgi:hypothetical protein